MDPNERSESISRLQALAAEERLAHPEEDEAAISAALDLIEERVRARAVHRRRSQLLIVAATLVGVLTAVLSLWPRRR
jgi:hypothetical protein